MLWFPVTFKQRAAAGGTVGDGRTGSASFAGKTARELHPALSQCACPTGQNEAHFKKI